MTPQELTRYSRHLLLPEVGLAGQERLLASSVLIVGAGGLGSPLALYLAAAGVGRLGLVDFDEVDASNLQRQILHGTPDIGRAKLDSASERIAHINPGVQLECFPVRLDRHNAMDILRGFDVVVDGTDNFATRYLINDAAVMLGIPNVYGSIYRFEGQVSVFGAPGPCYRCLYPEPPPPGLAPSCAEGGVLGVLPGTVGTLQATEVLKIILGMGDSLRGRLLMFDALAMRFETMAIPRDRDCPVCGEHPSITELVDYDAFCGTPPAATVPEISVGELRDRMDRVQLIDVRSEAERRVASLGGLHIPLEELESGRVALDAGADLVVYCRTGARSARAVAALLRQGYSRAVNLRGGVRAWSEEIDPSLPLY